MNSINNEYLEEAAKASEKKRNYRSIAIAAAACLILSATGLLLRHSLLEHTQPNMKQETPSGYASEYFTLNIQYSPT